MSARTRRARGTSRGCKHVQAPSPAPCLTGSPPAGKLLSAKTALPDVRASMMARLEGMRSELDDSHAAFIKELAAASSRLSKRVKLDLQSSRKIAEDVEREHTEFIADFSEDLNEIQPSIYEIIPREMRPAHTQVACEEAMDVTQPHFSKAAISELLRSLETSIEALRSKYAK